MQIHSENTISLHLNTKLGNFLSALYLLGLGVRVRVGVRLGLSLGLGLMVRFMVRI